jgi:hypothetical protein
MNKLIKNYVINIKYKTTTFLSYQSLMSYIDDVNQERIHIYRQKMRSICYFVIITRSNIIKIASELTRHFINFDLKYLKVTNLWIHLNSWHATSSLWTTLMLELDDEWFLLDDYIVSYIDDSQSLYMSDISLTC